jgi:aspartyl protease family protein
MALSSGVRALLAEAAAWAGAGAAAVVVALNFDQIQQLAATQLPRIEAVEPVSVPNAPGVQSPSAQGAFEIRSDRAGHFIAPAEINGRDVRVMVDTGATVVALRYEDAEELGLSLRPGDFTQRVMTANGPARVAPVTLDRVELGDIEVRNVRAVVAERGRLDITLLGMTYLSRIGRVEMAGGRLMLHR